MGKTFETKRKILELLTAKPKTATDLSRGCGLAQSTVCQHLAELRAMGAIRLADEASRRKWKYYMRSSELDSTVKPITIGITI